ncbi:RN216 ligase, partial [Pseudoatta argentina]
MDKDGFNLLIQRQQRLSMEEQTLLKNSIYNMDGFHSMMNFILNKENNNIQNCLNIRNNPGPSTQEIPLEMNHSTDCVSERPEMPYSFVESRNAEVFNNPGSSTMEIQSEIGHNTDEVSEQLEVLDCLMECINSEILDNSKLATSEIQSKISVSTDNISEQSGTSNFPECIDAEVVGNPGSSTMKVQSEIANKVFKQPKALNFSRKYPSAEVIDVSSDSDTSDDFFKNSENSSENSSENCFENSNDSYDDISIINTVNKTIIDEPIFSCSTSQLNGNNDNISLTNEIHVLTTGSDRQAANVNNKIQDRPKEDIEENNNDVLYIKRKRLNISRSGCSKDSEDTFLDAKDFYRLPSIDELQKDAKLIHALLPRYSYHSIHRKLVIHRFARNRIELTLWELLPKKRPLPQYLKKRKCLDEINFIEHEENSHFFLLEDQVDINTALGKKEQLCAKNEVIANDRKSKNIEFVSSLGENDEMKKNMSEVAASNNMNDTNQSIIPLKKTKLNHKSDESIISVKDGSNTSNINIVPNSKIFTSPEVCTESKELHSIKNSEVRKMYEPDRHSEFYKVRKVVAPAKLTFPNTQKDLFPNTHEKFHKPTTPLLSPPKLKVLKNTSTMLPIDVSIPMCSIPKKMGPTNIMKQNKPIIVPNSNSSISQYPIGGRFTTCNLTYPNVIKQNEPIAHVSHLNSSLFTSTSMLLGTSSNDKRASDMRVVPLPPSMCQSINRVKIESRIEPYVKVIEKDGTKVINVHTTKTVIPATINTPSTSVVPAQSTLHLQKASNSNMTTSQVYDKGSLQQSPILTQTKFITMYDPNKMNCRIEQLEKKDAIGIKKLKIHTYMDKTEEVTNNAEQKEIVLNEKATKIFVKLIPMFPTVKTSFIKKLCYDVKDDGRDEIPIIAALVETLLNCDQKNLSVEQAIMKPLEATTSKSYDMNEQYADLLMIFPEADPVYLRKIAEEIYSDPERIKQFVQSKLENPDYPTRAQYLAKQKITEQQKQYTTDFQVKQFLEIFPDPFAYFEDDKRKCEFNPHAVDFLKYYFSKMRVNTLVKAYSQYMNNLSLTAKALEALNPDMKTKRYCNKTTVTEDIPFLQECAFIQHKAELKKYLDEVKTKEEQEFSELKAKNELLECQCCYDDECMPSKCSTCEDGHIFCNSCIIRSTDVVLGDGNTRVDCLLRCGSEFPLSILQRVLPPTKFSILLCKRQEAEVIAAGVDGLVSCPFCHFASIPPLEDKIFKCLNPECMKESCRLCKELNHIPLKCNEKKSESARLYLEEKMTQALVRKCYRCSRMFFKEEGCNKMTCICGAQMCYICDKPVTDYKHFQGQGAKCSNLCPLWSDDRRLNAEGVIKVCQETMKQIKEKDPHIDINVDALLPKLPPKSKGPHEDIQNAMVGLRDRIARQLQ